MARPGSQRSARARGPAPGGLYMVAPRGGTGLSRARSLTAGVWREPLRACFRAASSPRGAALPPRGSELPGRRGIAVSPLPPWAGTAGSRPSLAPLLPRARAGTRPQAAVRAGGPPGAWLGGRPLAAPPPGLLGRHRRRPRGTHESDPRGRRLRRAGDKGACLCRVRALMSVL